MEITLSKKKIISFAAIIVLVALGIFGYFTSRSGRANHVDASAAPSLNEPAFTAIGTIFSPDVSSGIDAWETRACANMTADGCTIFKNIYSSALWDAAQSGTLATGQSIAYVSVAENLKDGGQVWKLSTSNPASPFMFVQVEKDPATQKWLLVRVLFDQEARTRYGS
jgi:hypothetical protein